MIGCVCSYVDRQEVPDGVGGYPAVAERAMYSSPFVHTLYVLIHKGCSKAEQRG